MTIPEGLEQALEQTGIPVKYYDYEGTKPEYIVYNEEAEQPVNHSDNLPRNHIIWWQVHIFSPKTFDFRGRKKEVINLLTKAGFSITDIVTLYEKETNTIHVVISCNAGE